MFKQHEIRNDVVLGRSKGTQWELGNRKNKKSLPPLHTPTPPHPFEPSHWLHKISISKTI
jgi:hypothetical protein